MMIQERVTKKCDKCNSTLRITKAPVWECDECGSSMTDNHLDITIHFHDDVPKEYSKYDKHNDNDSAGMEFCSWKCLIKKLRTIKTDYFISLPFLSFDEQYGNGCKADDFFAELKGG